MGSNCPHPTGDMKVCALSKFKNFYSTLLTKIHVDAPESIVVKHGAKWATIPRLKTTRGPDLQISFNFFQQNCLKKQTLPAQKQTTHRYKKRLSGEHRKVALFSSGREQTELKGG